MIGQKRNRDPIDPVWGSKKQLGYLVGGLGTTTDVHEIGHMLGLDDRYTDYENPKKATEFRSMPHDGYENDLMATPNTKSLNQSHYDDIVKYTVFKLGQGQQNLLQKYRSNTLNVTTIFDGFRSSASDPETIPQGFQDRLKQSSYEIYIYHIVDLGRAGNGNA
ncbi:hypothetical protein ACTJJ0_13040 [Chitinophaga sp. 22321]|uniref:Uncharacterized protein n=1 Tax=Chitinophaga hostae TaxID=2831022 RepID=A0ABS5J1C0_9BACT|nr:hypothetical protein [Chitinophaga hostae]MBS0028866.1 hypothetical protein [Chitinophaga hostae]